MKKRNLLVAALSLCLVAIIAVGGTLAYFTDQTQTMTNTFTTGKVDIDLYESVPTKYNPETNASEIITNRDGTPFVDPEDYWYQDGSKFPDTKVGLTYTSVLPGDELPKDMRVLINKDSMPCFFAVHLWVDPKNEIAENNIDSLKAIMETSLTRISTNCASIPATPADNDYTMPTPNDNGQWSGSGWKAFRLDDGSVVMVGTPHWTGISGKTQPLCTGKPGSSEQVVDQIFVGEPDRGNNYADGTTYGNELAGASFTIEAEAFAIQYDNLSTTIKGNDDWEGTGKNWSEFAHMVVDACNAGNPDDVFETAN